jgi:hypothetical protein
MQQLKIATKQGGWFFYCKSDFGQHWINLYLVQTANFYGNNPDNAQMVLAFQDGSKVTLGGQTAINCWAEFELIRSRAMRRATN